MPTPPVATLFADEVDAWMKAHSDVQAAFDGGYSRTSAFKRLARGALLGTGAERKGSALAIYIPGDSARVKAACNGTDNRN